MKQQKNYKTAKMCWQETIIDDIFQWVFHIILMMILNVLDN